METKEVLSVDQAVALYRGALLFTLPVGEKRTITHTYYKDVCNDYQVHADPFLDDQMTNTTAWNYGLYINWEKPEVYSEDGMR